jgi:hypothetical protein
MPNVYLPGSGDVSQAINPWAWFTRIASGQIGFFNIKYGQICRSGARAAHS